jgi:GTP:adenosylcobinamide-phosphate guanylyltransferase
MNGDAAPRIPEARFSALVLAGQRSGGDPVAQAAGVSHKCLVPVAGVPMLVRVVEALAASRAVDLIAVSIEQPELVDALKPLMPLRQQGKLVVLPSRESPSLSALSVLETLADRVPWIITTADHALLTGDLVDSFVAAAEMPETDIAVGLTPASVLLSAFPDARRTFLRFRDGRYTGSNLFAILTPAGYEALRFWRRIERERKRPWRLAGAFGLENLLAYLLRRLTLENAMERASRVVQVRARAVITPVAEAGIDVDKPADLTLVEEILRRRA